ncbi:MAG: beta-class carbonic anhydrase [Verrucomicrobiota bacterium]
MKLFEAIVNANHRAVAGDASAGLRPADYENELPVIALTCVDPRLNALFPNVLGLPGDQFIWLRNAGNIITGPMSSTMRSLALACAVKGGREIAVIGHTDCQVGKTTTVQLLERFKALGVNRHLLPENLNEFFGMFGSDRQNVIKACEFVRQSPLIGANVPVHGLLVDIETGKLEWLVNGYETFGKLNDRWNEVVKSADQTVDALKGLGDFQIGEMKFPETKIGETVAKAEDWLSQKIGNLEMKPATPPKSPIPESAVNIAEKIVGFAEKHWPKPEDATGVPPQIPPKLPQPPRIRPRMQMRKGGS